MVCSVCFALLRTQKERTSFFLTKYTENHFLIYRKILILAFFLFLAYFTEIDYFLCSGFSNPLVYGDVFQLVVPVIIYANAETDKLKIYSDNKDKSGVYR